MMISLAFESQRIKSNYKMKSYEKYILGYPLQWVQ
jgi:hypothetical protein